MALYKNLTQESPLTAVEFSPVSDGNFSFFYIDSPIKTEGVKKWLTSPEMGQEIIAETKIEGHPVLVTHGDKPQDEIRKILETRGDKLHLEVHKKPLDLWKAIALLAVPGQTLQLTSSLLRANRKLDWGLFVFAASNLLGHVIGWTYGSQKSPDIHRLRHLKEQFNDRIGVHVPQGEQLPSSQEDRSVLHDEPKAPLTTLEKFSGWLQKYSVTVGEIFLRYFGAFALAFPVSQWKTGAKKLAQGEFKEAFHAARNPKTIITAIGLGSLFGKTLALTSKVPDPYNPKPHTWLDTAREKFTFRTGGIIEALAFGTMAFDSFADKNRKIRFGGKEYHDYLGGIGATMFTIRYITRYWAKYGEKKVDMDDLYAHVSDSLAKMSPEELPQLMADTAASLKEHFKDKPMEFGQIYTQMMTDLYRYHHIALNNLGTEPEERLAKKSGGVQMKHTLKHPPRRNESHAEMVKASESQPSSLGVGA